jgi:hypothetical protein
MRLSRKRRALIKLAMWKHKHGPTLERVMKVQKNNNRGYGREGFHDDKYVNRGKHYNRNKANTVRPYATEKKQSEEDLQLATDGIIDLVSLLELVLSEVMSSADMRVIELLKKEKLLRELMFEPERGRYSQLALTRKYWSPWHTDDNITMTLLCVFSPLLAEEANFNDILCYFVLPTVGKCVPMRNTDIILFDSTVGHCVTNYRCNDAYIFSLFTGSKTAFAKMGEHDEVTDSMNESMFEEAERFIIA